MTARSITAVAALGALLLAAGCNGSESTDPQRNGNSSPTAEPAGDAPISAIEPPSGWQEVTTRDISFWVPADWETLEAPEDAGLLETTARGELEGGTLAVLNVVTVPTAETAAATWVQEMRTLGEVQDEQTFTLDGLTTTAPITLLDLTYSLEGSTARVWVLVFEHEAGDSYNLSFLAEEDTFDEEQAADLLGTLGDA